MTDMDIRGTGTVDGLRPPGPGSVAWRKLGDDRLLLVAAPTLILQVAHPVVGAGVLQYSDFKAEPWQRLHRTLKSLTTLVYGSPAMADAESARLRELHKTMKGVDDRGRRWSALNPQAYAWVHATLVWGTVQAHELFGIPFTEAEKAQFYQEWLQLGRIMGIRDHQLPADWTGFCAYFDEMVNSRLEVNQSVLDVLAATDNPPSLPLLPEPVWNLVAGRSFGRLSHLTTVATLPPVLREKLGLELSPAQERRLRRHARRIRVAFRMLPPSMRYSPYVTGVRFKARHPGWHLPSRTGRARRSKTAA